MTTQISGAFPATLMTATPEGGFDLATTLSRLTIKATQPGMGTLKNLCPEYANNANSLIAVSHVVAVHYRPSPRRINIGLKVEKPHE